MLDAERIHQAVSVLMTEAQGGNAALAVTMLEELLTAERERMAGEDLEALLTLEAWSDGSALWPAGEVETARVQLAAEQALRERGLWDGYRRRVQRQLLVRSLRWCAGLLAWGVAVLAAVFVLIAGGDRLLRWMGFL